MAGFEFTKYVTYEDTGSIIAIRGLNCKNGSLDLRDVKYIDNSDFSKLSRSKLYVGDILYTYVGTVGEVAVVDKNDKYYLAPNVSRIKLSKDYNSDFMKQLLGSKKFYYKIVFPLIATSSQPALSMENLRRFKLRVPSIKEQKKIASLFKAIDERIATQNKIIEDLKKLKSAISKLLFAQKPNGWKRLDTLFSKGKAGGTPTSTNKEYYNGEIPFLSINDITKQGKYVRCTENHLSQNGLEKSSAWVVPEYSLIMSMYASVGLVTINEVPLATSQAMFAMQLKDKDLLDYLYYYLSYFRYRHIHKYLETGTQSNINADIVRGIMIPTYGYRHNIEIASTLQGIDAKVDNELSVLDQLNRQKNYFLSQMFI